MNKLIPIKTETFHVSTSEPTEVPFDDKEGGMHFIFHLHYVDTEEQGYVDVIPDGPWIVNIEIYTPFYLIVGIKPKFQGSYRDKEKLYFSFEVQPRSIDDRHKGEVTFYYEEGSFANLPPL